MELEYVVVHHHKKPLTTRRQKNENFHPKNENFHLKKKYSWRDPKTKHELTAGGILFYDEYGIWAIGENENGKLVYNDIGGKYSYEDGSIYVTISRELAEETYRTCELTSSDIDQLEKTSKKVYINGHEGKPVYLCLLVNLKTIQELKSKHNFKFALNSESFNESRKQTLLQNPYVPEHLYTFCLQYIKYEEIDSYTVGGRLGKILSNINIKSFGTKKT